MKVKTLTWQLYDVYNNLHTFYVESDTAKNRDEWSYIIYNALIETDCICSLPKLFKILSHIKF